MKRFLLLAGIFLFFIILLGWGAKVYFFSPGTPIVFTIKSGQSGAAVGRELKEKGIIRSELLFRIILKLTSSATDLKAGAFDLRKNMSDLEVINCIKSGSCTHYEKVTFLEGWRSEEIAEELAEMGITDAHEFLRIVRQENLEGKLFPSTYLFASNSSARKVVDKMVAQYHERIDPLFAQYPTNLTENQVLTLASIVEREAVVHDERPKIAAVYINRFNIGKKLEADPTVQYALGFFLKENRYWKKGLTYADLKTDSPYNTYRYPGLPPGPICNPSYESIKAVLTPEPDFDALYFVAESEGRHVFSRTFDEHRRNIRRIRGK